jgi:transposase-like protein
MAGTAQQLSQVPFTLRELARVETALFQAKGDRFTTIQRLFFEHLLSSPDMNVAEAARSVGITKPTADRWLTKQEVRQELDKLMQERLKRTGIDKDKLLLRIVDCLEMAMGEKPIKKNVFNAKEDRFTQHEIFETDLAATARFTDQLGKHFNLFADNQQSGVSVHINMNLGAPTATTARQDHIEGETVDDNTLAEIESDNLKDINTLARALTATAVAAWEDASDAE